MPKRRLHQGWYDPRHGDPPIRIKSLSIGRKPFEPDRTNCFSLYLIESGSGTFWADTSRFPFQTDSLLCFVPYQHIRLVPDTPVRGRIIQFHANFLCVETFHAETGCSGILFNDPFGIPLVRLDEQTRSRIMILVEQIEREQSEQNLAYGEIMLASLKILLILATRLKSHDAQSGATDAIEFRNPVLDQLRDLIEHNYSRWHSPALYAEQLHLTPKTLGRIVREHLGTTPTDLIRNRILIHAKWHLLHTLKTVKEISRELGFRDELYFSRLFKKATGCSPTLFREFETEIRGGSNLSMVSAQAPILPKRP